MENTGRIKKGGWIKLGENRNIRGKEGENDTKRHTKGGII
jgi:hypothetical protein